MVKKRAKKKASKSVKKAAKKGGSKEVLNYFKKHKGEHDIKDLAKEALKAGYSKKDINTALASSKPKKAKVKKVKKGAKPAKVVKTKSVSTKPIEKKALDKIQKFGIGKTVRGSRKIERVPTGIKNFDSLIEGGMEKNSTNLIVGGSGSGKSIFAVQFLMEGIKKGESCLYITFEEKKKEFYDNMIEFGWDLEKYEKQGKFVFLEYKPGKVKTMLEEGGGIIESIVLRKKISRIVIDSITSFELLFGTDIKKRSAALSLFGMLRRWDTTALLTYEGDPFRDKKAASRTLAFEVDSIILLYFVREKNQRERFIEILKMRGTKHSRGVHPLSIEKSGVVVSKSIAPDNIKF
jgi:circadian clock protein KaiC